MNDITRWLLFYIAPAIPVMFALWSLGQRKKADNSEVPNQNGIFVGIENRLERNLKTSGLSSTIRNQLGAFLFGWKGILGIIIFLLFFSPNPVSIYLDSLYSYGRNIPVVGLVIFIVYIFWMWSSTMRGVKLDNPGIDLKEDLNKPYDEWAWNSALSDGKIVIFDSKRIFLIIILWLIGGFMILFGLLSILMVMQGVMAFLPFAIIATLLGLVVPFGFLVHSNMRILKEAKKRNEFIPEAELRLRISKIVYGSMIIVAFSVAGYLYKNDLNFVAWGTVTSHGQVIYRGGLEENDYKNNTYIIDGVPRKFVDGISDLGPDMGYGLGWIYIRTYGAFASKDLNGDNRQDAVLTLMREGVGSSNETVYGPYYVVATISSDTGYIGTNAFMIDDTVSPDKKYLPQIKFVGNQIKVGPHNSDIHTFRTFIIDQDKLIELIR